MEARFSAAALAMNWLTAILSRTDNSSSSGGGMKLRLRLGGVDHDVDWLGAEARQILGPLRSWSRGCRSCTTRRRC